MSTANQEVINKGITAAEQLASAGALNAEQVREFTQYVVDETKWKGNVRFETFASQTWELSSLSLGRRGLIPATEASDPNFRRSLSTSKIEMTPKEVILPVEVSDRFYEENVEGKSVESKVLGMFARQFANDLEGMFWHGDTLGPSILQSDLFDGGHETYYVKDSLHALMDGWVKKAVAGGRVVDGAGREMSSKIVSEAIRTLPTKYRQNMSNLRLWGAPNTFQLWLEALSQRGTSLGDSVTTGATGLKPFGLTPVPASLLSFEPKIVKHVTLNGTTAASLGYTDVTDVVVTVSTLNATPTAKLVLDTDYSLDAANGTITRIGGAISDGQTVKVTFSAKPVLILTPANNLIVGMSRDIRLESARDIYKRANGYVITTKVAIQLENPDAVVVVKNLSDEIA